MMKTLIATLLAASFVSAASAAEAYRYVYADLYGTPALVLSSADDGTVELVGAFTLTDVDDWDPALHPGQSLTYTHSYAADAPPVFAFSYTVCESASACDDESSYLLFDDNDPGVTPRVTVVEQQGVVSVALSYDLVSATFAVPEPANAALMAAALCLLGGLARRRAA